MKSSKNNIENNEMFSIQLNDNASETFEKIETIQFIPEENDDTDISNILSSMDNNTTIHKQEDSKEEIIHLINRKNSFNTPKKIIRNMSGSEMYFSPRPVLLYNNNKSFFK